ncbi:YdeI/OmpD-associated family protein [Pedobacter sp. GSP4]|uniref:YdeI/OmpD-associated family protein n=1 Tax=Pedobacter sp. GSP4 TaxID=3453716 RepID=UPI003EEBC2F3
MENVLLKKLQVKPGHTIQVVDAPEHAASILGNIPDGVSVQYDNNSNFNILLTFTTTKDQLKKQIESYLKRIDQKTIFWVFYPKKSAKINSDLDMMKSWEELSTFGLTPCASAAVNETWTALRLKFISEVKPSGLRNDHIKTNQFGEYVDPVNKTVKLPDDLSLAMKDHPQAHAYFHQLAYSHKKEYVLWVLSAKQEKTRASRIEKTVEMLLNRKKNPADK